MHLAIIGNGITGTTVARYVRKVKDWDITVISSETEYFFSRTALMYIYMGHMEYKDTKPYEDWFWDKNDINLEYNHVTNINIDQKKLELREGSPIGYDKLVIATGSRPNKFGWPGQNLDGVQGLYSYQDLQRMEKNTKNIDRAAIVGGGLIGVEVAEMLHSRNIPVTFLVRETNYWDNALPKEEAQLVNCEICRHNHIDLRLETELKEILGNGEGRVRAVTTNKGDEIPCQFVALTPGVHPNIELVKNSDIATDKGILVNHYFETNHDNIYAAGDCVQFSNADENEQEIEQLWYTGRKHGEALARILCGERTPYDRGIWFNSAKFFNIEWQTYGRVPPQLPHGVGTFYWEHENGEHCMRINFEKSRAVTGFNVMGIRLRQRVCEQWIDQGRSLEYVLQHLGEVMFDPEFAENHESAIIEYYNQSNPEKDALQLEKKRGLFGLFQFNNKQTA